MPDVTRNVGEVGEQALRRPRTIFSSSSMHRILPKRRLSVPSVVTNRRPATGTVRPASAAATAGAAAAKVVPDVLKVPPSRCPALAGFKSVEAVINERRREALARLEAVINERRREAL